MRSRVNRYSLIRLLLIVELALAAWLVAAPASAHSADATLWVSNASVGPYNLTIWTYPGTVYVGSTHFIVAVADAADGRPVLNTAVEVRATSTEGEGEAVVQPALLGSDPQSAFLYEANIKIEQEGAHRITVAVADSSGAVGTTSFDVNVVSAGVFKWIITGLLLHVLLTALWFIKEGITTWRKPAPEFTLAPKW